MGSTANVLRGMIYKPGTFGEQGHYSGQEYPYLYNLFDQYCSLGKYNDGYSYNMMFVGPGWMNKMGRWEAPAALPIGIAAGKTRWHAFATVLCSRGLNSLKSADHCF